MRGKNTDQKTCMSGSGLKTSPASGIFGQYAFFVSFFRDVEIVECLWFWCFLVLDFFLQTLFVCLFVCRDANHSVAIELNDPELIQPVTVLSGLFQHHMQQLGTGRPYSVQAVSSGSCPLLPLPQLLARSNWCVYACLLPDSTLDQHPEVAVRMKHYERVTEIVKSHPTLHRARANSCSGQRVKQVYSLRNELDGADSN